LPGNWWRTRDAVTSAIEEHRYNEAAAALYGFVWHVFCDWYLELIKPILAGDDEAGRAETRHVAAWILDQILLLLHPFMPFLTEELWQRTGEAGPARDTPLIVAPWPAYEGLGDAAAEAEINWIIELVSAIRSVRSEMNVPAAARIACVIAGAGPETRRRAAHWQTEIARLARLESLSFADQVPEAAAQIVLGEATVALPPGRCHRPCRGTRPARQGARSDRQGHRRHRRPARQPGLSRQGAAKTWWKNPANAALTSKPAKPGSPKPWAACIR
jgi:valyl-tRNA synthetase